MGQPYRKPTREEEEERVGYTLRLLARGTSKCQIKRFLTARYGVTARTSERYLSRAREALRERAGRSLEGHRLDAFSLYESIIRDPGTTTREKLLAQDQIDRLLGLKVLGKISQVGR